MGRNWRNRIQCWINGHKPFVTRYHPGVPGKWMSECGRCGAKYGVGLIDVVVPVIYPHNPYAGMGPEEVCESKLDDMRRSNRKQRGMYWVDRARHSEPPAATNATRLAAYQCKRLAHDAFDSYDAAMTAKGLR